MTDPEPSITLTECSEISAAIESMGLGKADTVRSIARLSGGVSCDVYRVVLNAQTICVKRALPKLRVKADWRAPATRSASEVAWLRLAGQVLPRSVPAVLGEDPAHHLFAMQYFPAEEYPVWKTLLANGRIEPDFAKEVGRATARVHAATAHNAEVAKDFSNDEQFQALRLDPFLLHCAAKHESVASRLRALAEGVAKSRIALMHGDVSPKNILSGPDGPVFLDAETTCYGDPAFDLAFCLTHLMLKSVWHPEWRAGYRECFSELVLGYAAEITWENPEHLEVRAADLIAALLLARVDGKSPVEYLDERKRDFVIQKAIEFLKTPGDGLDSVAEHWSRAADDAFERNT